MRVRWQNYRGYEDTGWLDFDSLTLLVGANNAGKTSLYSPILLLKQTLEHARPETALLSQGPLYDAGRFKDFVRDHDLSNLVTLSLDLGNEANIEVGAGVAKPRIIELRFRAADEDGHRVELERYRLLDSRGRSLLRRQLRDDGSYGLDGPLLPSEKKIGRPPGPVSKMRESLRMEAPEHFLFSGVAGLNRVSDLSVARREHRERVDAWLNAGLRLFRVQHVVNEAVRQLLASVSYVSPLRALPQRVYRVSPEPPRSVGTTGEFAPELLFRDHTEGDGKVLAGVNAFLAGCGYGGISFKSDPENSAFELLVGGTHGSPPANLVDSGMGLSQLLPLVTQSFVSPAQSLALVQQPEIHLNPALQVRLMEHFVSRSERGQEFLIETHSEHLLLRLRLLVARGSVDSSTLRLLYADKAERRSTVREIHIGEAGDIAKDEWPDGFFAEQLEDSLLMAREQARRARFSAADD